MENKRLDDLRKRAENILGADSFDFVGNSTDDLQTALHELCTYQIELELQNEELRRIQEKIIEARDQYVDLYDFMPIGYLTLSEKKIIMEINLIGADLLGETKNSLQGQPLSRFILDEDQDIFYSCFKKLIAGAPRQPCDLRMLRRDGSWFWAKLECFSKVNQDKSGSHIRIALHDNTETKHLETEIIKTKKLEATALLAGGIAHDFNNLLAVILGNLELAEEDMLQGRPFQEKMQDARQACQSATNLTKQFLTFSSGGDPVPILTPIEPLITDSARLALAGSNVDFECSFPADLKNVEVDTGQISLAVGHVINNAKEAMPEGGMIRIYAENADFIPGKDLEAMKDSDVKYVKITIQDQGAGIPAEILPQVFDPYFTSKQVYHKKGLGLGLTVTYSIIQKHGGSIDIASQENTGTTVTIFLPASEGQIIPQEPEPEIWKAPLVARKILFMDDDEMMRKMTSKMLESLDYEVEVACNGEEAIQLYTKAMRSDRPFGAVMLDLTIKGGMGGRETIKKLLELDPDIRAIVSSGYSNDPVMSNFRQYGFLGILPKPFRVSDLKKSIGSIVDAAEE
jgi:PAS domain S-box-containing protein